MPILSYQRAAGKLYSQVNSSLDCGHFSTTFEIQNDGRKSIDDLARQERSDDATQIAIRAAKSLVAIRSVTKNGNKINDFGFAYLGSGYVFAYGCYVLTARHVLNRHVAEIRGDERVYIAQIESPTGSDIGMEIGFAPNEKATPARGKVIYSGPSVHNADHDFSIIRLDKKTTANPLPVSAASEEELIGAEMASIGLPFDLQKGEPLRAFADTACKGLIDDPAKKKKLGGIATSCQSSAGDSGGAVLAKVNVQGQFVWRAVGAMAQVDTLKSSDVSTRALNDDRMRAFSINEYKEQILRMIQADSSRNPCN